MLIDFGGELVDSLRHTDWMVASQRFFWSAKSLDDIQLFCWTLFINWKIIDQ